MKKIIQVLVPLFLAVSSTFIVASCAKKETVCPEHFTGANCDIETPPQYLIIKEVRCITYKVVKQPTKIYTALSFGSRNTAAEYKVTATVATGGNLWMDASNFQVPAYGTLHMELYDNSNPNTFGVYIGKATTQPYQADKRFPAILTVKSSEVEYELRVGYKW